MDPKLLKNNQREPPKLVILLGFCITSTGHNHSPERQISQPAPS